MEDPLSLWNDGDSKSAIVDFVENAASNCRRKSAPPCSITTEPCGARSRCRSSSTSSSAGSRRWPRKSELRERQPWKAAHERDYAWLGAVVAEHYAGDDTNVKVLGAGILAAYAGMSVEDFEAQAGGFLRSAQHPTLGRSYLECAYAPMVELLDYLRANGFKNYIVSGGGRDFMRPISQELYGIPREGVIGSTAELAYTSDDRGGTITHTAEPEYLDDGPQKPIRIWSRTGRRPLLAAGNSNGDIPMLDFTQHRHKPSMRLLVLHDDSDREFEYTTGAEQSLEKARADGWTIVSIAGDWATVF